MELPALPLTLHEGLHLRLPLGPGLVSENDMGMWKLLSFLVNWASLWGVRLLKPIFFPTAQKYISGAYPYSMEVFLGSSEETAFTEAV